MNRTYRILSILSVVALGLPLGGCGDGGDDSGSTLGSAAAFVKGSMNKGSVIVNGVTFNDASATVVAEPGGPATTADLADGMTVNVKGTVNADGVTGTADRIGVQNELLGSISAVGTADSFTALGQQVFVDGQTVFAGGVNALTDLAAGNNVEVHGTRDADGGIRATRVERTQQAGRELRGTVSNASAGGFSIGDLQIVRDAGTVVVPAGASFADGDLVQVQLSADNRATQIKVEGAQNEFEAAEGQHVRLEGFVTGRASASDKDFEVDGQPVQLANGARFEGGLPADLVNDVKVQVEGTKQGGTLVANKIKFQASIRLEGNAGAVNAESRSFTLFGKTIALTEKTDNRAGDLSAIAAGTGMRVRGFLNRDNNTITATRIDTESNPVRPGDEILQGPVSSFSAAGKTMTILGISVTASGTQQFRDDRDDDSPSGDQPVNGDQFFGMLQADRTIVKAKGSFSGGSFSATEVEIE
jgi:hypothetical protein